MYKNHSTNHTLNICTYSVPNWYTPVSTLLFSFYLATQIDPIFLGLRHSITNNLESLACQTLVSSTVTAVCILNGRLIRVNFKRNAGRPPLILRKKGKAPRPSISQGSKSHYFFYSVVYRDCIGYSVIHIYTLISYIA